MSRGAEKCTAKITLSGNIIVGERRRGSWSEEQGGVFGSVWFFFFSSMLESSKAILGSKLRGNALGF